MGDVKPFWIEFGGWPAEVSESRVPPFPRGCGVTARDLTDALDLVRRGFYIDRELPPVTRILEDITEPPGVWLSTRPALSQERGIWWPTPWYPERTIVAGSLLPQLGPDPTFLGIPEPDFASAALVAKAPPRWPSRPVFAATNTIVELLTQAAGPRRQGATPTAIGDLEQRLRVRLPDDLCAYLRWSDGWDAAFGAGWLALNSVEGIHDANDDAFRLDFPGLLDVGGDGGEVTYALDYRGGSAPTALVALERTDPESIRWIAPSLTEALVRVLAEPSGPWGEPEP